MRDLDPKEWPLIASTLNSMPVHHKRQLDEYLREIRLDALRAAAAVLHGTEGADQLDEMIARLQTQ